MTNENFRDFGMDNSEVERWVEWQADAGLAFQAAKLALLDLGKLEVEVFPMEETVRTGNDQCPGGGYETARLPHLRVRAKGDGSRWCLLHAEAGELHVEAISRVDGTECTTSKTTIIPVHEDSNHGRDIGAGRDAAQAALAALGI